MLAGFPEAAPLEGLADSSLPRLAALAFIAGLPMGALVLAPKEALIFCASLLAGMALYRFAFEGAGS